MNHSDLTFVPGDLVLVDPTDEGLPTWKDLCVIREHLTEGIADEPIDDYWVVWLHNGECADDFVTPKGACKVGSMSMRDIYALCDSEGWSRQKAESYLERGGAAYFIRATEDRVDPGVEREIRRDALREVTTRIGEELGKLKSKSKRALRANDFRKAADIKTEMKGLENTLEIIIEIGEEINDTSVFERSRQAH